MSSRAVRRLERKKLLDAGASVKEDSRYSDSDNIEDEKPVKSFNAFAFLGDDGGEEEEEDEVEEESQNEVGTKHATKEASVGASAKSKKSKNTGKSKKVNNNTTKKGTGADDLDDDELDKILAEVKQKDKKAAKGSKNKKITPVEDAQANDTFAGDEDVEDLEWEFEQEDEISEYDSNYKFFTTSRLKEAIPILSIDNNKYLDSDNEFLNLFGKLSLDTIEDANTTTSLAISPEVLSQFKRLARLTRGWGGKDRRGVPGTTRKLLFTKIRDDWLPTSIKSMQMNEVMDDEELLEYFLYKEDDIIYRDEYFLNKIRNEKALGVKYFNFEKLSTPSNEERIANTRFYVSVVITPDPESLIQLIQRNPYHAETLLQVAMVLLRQGGDKSTSNALVEKCLFMFDRCLHKNFHELLQSSKNSLIHLPFERFMNRQFQLCLFRYIMILGERSTYFTAFTYCKLLLSFNPAEDPLGVRYFIDFYAIMSEEYDWLVKFSNSSLCTTYKKWFTPGIAFSTALALFRLGKVDELKKLLELAFKRHPLTAARLLESVALSSYEPEILNSATKLSDEVLLGTETYLVRATLIWKDQSEKQYLHDELTKLFTSQDASRQNTSEKPKKSFFSSIFGGLSATKDEIASAASIPLNLIRFAILSGENKIMAKIPEKVWERDDVLEYDILPPKDLSVVYNEHTGVGERSRTVDKLLNYVDQALLGAMVSQRSASDFNELDQLIDEAQRQGEEED